jgi:ATPase subunit of ABC transporter with duplicated ATPase domains
MTGLGLTAFGSDTPLDRLSGGQRTKVMLGKLLLDRADVLLLDEPTNFLDAAHIDWFAAYLTAYPGAFMIVSHDVAFLERIAAGILDIEFGAIRKYSCGYKAFLRQKAHLREDYIRQYNAQRREIERTEAFIRKNIAGQNTRIAQGRRTRLERMERLEKSGYAQKPNFRFSCKDVPAGTMLKVRNLEIGYHYPLLPGFGFSVESGQKLVITGFNGIGKSTLLKTLTGVIPALSGAFILHPMAKTGYYEQDLLWPNPDAAPLDIIAAAFPMINRKEARKALAQCGVKDEHVRQPVGTLSGGEQSKVKLCGLVLKKSNFLILDEPTNHLDAETKDTLKQALTEFRGSVILVTHEEQFYRGWADKVLNIG